MPEIIEDSGGYALGTVWERDGVWIAKYFVQTHTIVVKSREEGIEWVRSHGEIINASLD